MATTTLLTSEQYLALPDQFDQSGNRIKDELIGGELVRMPPAGLPHDLIENEIHEILAGYLRAHPELNLKSLIEIGAEVSKHDTFVPVVSAVQRSRLRGEARIFQGAPDLAIEVVSPYDTAKHLKRKIDTYIQGGSKSVWVVYPDAKSVAIYSGDSMREVKGDQKIEDPLLPGFSMPVASFFELT
jgi:Uma2 family endonuclease